jgi:hypothetical protein
MLRIADSGQDWLRPDPAYSRGIHIAHTPDGTLQSRTSRLRRPVLQSPMSLIQTQRGQALINLEGSPAICPMSALPVRRGAA